MSRSAPNSVSHIDTDVDIFHDAAKRAATPTTPGPVNRLNRALSWASSWDVVTLGRGFNWSQSQSTSENSPLNDHPLDTTSAARPNKFSVDDDDSDWGLPLHVRRKLDQELTSTSTATKQRQTKTLNTILAPSSSIVASPTKVPFPSWNRGDVSPSNSITPTRPGLSRSFTSLTGPRRRSSAKRVSLVAGQVSILHIDPPSPPPPPAEKERFSKPPRLPRFGSTSSFLSVQSASAPSEDSKESYLGGRSVDEFEIEGEIGRGAYGLVKLARQIMPDGTLGSSVILKQVIKQRILADCWKKHPKYGTIPIEIYVMSAISSATYTLPPVRPWDPARFDGVSDWVEGTVVNGHPNICPLLDFFEDQHYYHLVLPYTAAIMTDDLEPPANDLFDLVEVYPQGLPTALIRSYLGQIADALCFLHAKGIVHRDIKDENLVLGPQPGKCTLIDFGSSGVVRKNGYDTFSGTLDYAGPEILRGERYTGKEQDVWAFGVVGYVLLVGECPFATPEEAQEGLSSVFSKASIALDERCGGEHEGEGEEADGGGMLGDAATLVRECLSIDVRDRPTFERILESRFLVGG